MTDTPATRPGAPPERPSADWESGSPGVPAAFRRFGWILRRIRRRYGTTALVCYAIVGVFSVAYGIARLAWPHLPERRAVVVGLLAAGPLVVAFIWQRLVGVKAFGVEVTLAQFTVQIESTLATAFSESQYFSQNPEIYEVIDRILACETIELLEINLRNDPYWWDTRLFLQAALIEDYTKIQRIVFVDDDHRYWGMAAPRQVRRSLAHPAGMNLEQEYQQIAKEVQEDPEQNVSDAHRIVDKWSAQTFTKDGHDNDNYEKKVRKKLSARLVAKKIPLETASVECDTLDSALVHALVLKKGTRFVALTRTGRLLQVVNADAFATAQILYSRLSASVANADAPRPPSPPLIQGQPGGPPPNQGPPGQGGPIPGHDDGRWQGPPQPWVPPYNQPPWGWGPPPPPPPQGPPPPPWGPPPPPFLYSGQFVQPVWNSSFNQWGFWLFGFWIPLI